MGFQRAEGEKARLGSHYVWMKKVVDVTLKQGEQ